MQPAPVVVPAVPVLLEVVGPLVVEVPPGPVTRLITTILPALLPAPKEAVHPLTGEEATHLQMPDTADMATLPRRVVALPDTTTTRLAADLVRDGPRDPEGRAVIWDPHILTVLPPLVVLLAAAQTTCTTGELTAVATGPDPAIPEAHLPKEDLPTSLILSSSNLTISIRSPYRQELPEHHLPHPEEDLPSGVLRRQSGPVARP